MKPYKINFPEKNYYQFDTAGGSAYICYFLSYALYFKEYTDISNNIFAFNVDLVTKSKDNRIDNRIGFTIVSIVKQFLKDKQNAVIYVCDNADNREILRVKKFDSWFTKYDDGAIIKLNGKIKIDEFEIHNSILIHKENKKKNSFIEAFQSLNNQTK